MTTEESLITDELRARIGKEAPPTRLEVDKTGIRMFARAVGHTDLIFYDEEYARSKGYRSLVAPPGYFGTAVYLPGMPLGPEGRPRGGGMVHHDKLHRGLNGGGEAEYFGIPVCAGDVITSVQKTVSIRQTASSNLGPMLVIVNETTYWNQDGQRVCISRGTSLQY